MVSRPYEFDALTMRLVDLVRSRPLGSKFPSERNLEEALGVSRPALRTRLRVLELVGLLERRGTGGSFTRMIQPEDISFAMRIGFSGMNLDNEMSFRPVRAALERQAALSAAHRQDATALDELEHALNAIHSAESTVEMTRADLAFHAALFKASGEPSLQFMYGAVRELMDDSVTLRRDKLANTAAGLDESFRLHAEVFNAIKSGDTRRAMDAVDALLAQDLETH